MRNLRISVGYALSVDRILEYSKNVGYGMHLQSYTLLMCFRMLRQNVALHVLRYKLKCLTKRLDYENIFKGFQPN